MTNTVQQSWLNCIQNQTAVNRAFPNHAAPDLRGLLLLRVVIHTHGFLNVVGRFHQIPSGASKQWERRGYRELDVSIEVHGPTIQHFSPQLILDGGFYVDFHIQPEKLDVVSISGQSLLVTSGKAFRVNFTPDPLLQEFHANQDRVGFDIEPRG